MDLIDHAIWWHVYPLGACGAPIHATGSAQVEHRLSRLEAWLDYVVELGCSGLLLGPLFASATHGYDTLDHFRVDPRLGDDADFDRLVHQAHARGLSIMLDGVFNHVGAGHEWVVSGSDRVRRHGGRPAVWEGHDDLVELDHSKPEVADFVVEVMLHWLRRGVAAWRLDVAYAVPAEFWREVTGRVRQEFPDALFLGEVLHGDYAAIADAGALDTVTHYELWKAIWSSIKDENFWELAWALERNTILSGPHVLQTFVGNHDVTRIASQVGEHHAGLAAALLFTLPGMPSVYYGDEQGFTGVKGTGSYADDPLRPSLPDHPDDLAPFGTRLYRLYQDLIGFRRRHPWLTRANVRVIGKDLTWISYECTHAGHSLRATITLEPSLSFHAVADDSESLAWQHPGALLQR